MSMQLAITDTYLRPSLEPSRPCGLTREVGAITTVLPVDQLMLALVPVGSYPEEADWHTPVDLDGATITIGPGGDVDPGIGRYVMYVRTVDDDPPAEPVRACYLVEIVAPPQ